MSIMFCFLFAFSQMAFIITSKSIIPSPRRQPLRIMGISCHKCSNTGLSMTLKSLKCAATARREILDIRHRVAAYDSAVADIEHSADVGMIHLFKDKMRSPCR